jgi:hypothetical protein
MPAAFPAYFPPSAAGHRFLDILTNYVKLNDISAMSRLMRETCSGKEAGFHISTATGGTSGVGFAPLRLLML